MTIIQIISVFLIVLSVSDLIIFFSKRTDFKRYQKNLGLSMLLNIACNISYLLFMHKPFGNIAHICYGVYEACLISSLFCIVWFCVRYFNVKKKFYHIFDIMSLAICADIVLLIINSLFVQSIVYKNLQTETGEILISLGERWALNFHEIICLLTAVIALSIIGFAILKSNGYFRKRNIKLFILLSFLLISEWVFLKTNHPFDLASGFVGICYILIYIFTIISEPKALLKETLGQVFTSMSEYLFVFDKENHCIFTSNSAKHSILSKVKKEYMENKLKEWLNSPEKHQTNTVIQDFPFSVDGKLGYYRLSIHLFADNVKSDSENLNYMGCYVIIMDQTEEKQLRDNLRFASIHDRLTSLYNFDYFTERASDFLNGQPSENHVMIQFDVKEFKLINDQFDSETADGVLLHIAHILRLKYGMYGLYCRQGKDKFFVLINEKDYSENYLMDVIGQIQSYSLPNKYYHIHVYAGVYIFDSSTTDIRYISDCCYRAVCKMKDSYENILYYDDKMRQDAINDQYVSNRLLSAIKNRHIEIFLQPQVDKNGKLLGAEALARWRDPQKGCLLPKDFIPFLEHNGLIYKLDQHIWELACQTVKKWSDSGENSLYIAVNVSIQDIHYIDVCSELENDVEKYGISKDRLRVEITESAIADAPDKLLNLITRLRKSGFCVEMDDFGSGSSTLAMMKDFPVDAVKLDMKFLSEMTISTKGKIIIEAVLALCRSLDISMVAEGVETVEQSEFLINKGCEIMQGYLFSKPVSVNEFEQRYLLN